MDHIFGRGPKGPAPPSRGAVAGVKADMQRAKDGFDPKNPNGTGMAWTHNFLNQKPWHPMSFKNRMRVWERQQDKSEQDKTKEKAQAEFDAEQEYLKTLSYLSPEEQQRYREVQSVSFMYTKPPGLDAALARDAEAEKKKVTSQQPQAAAGSSAPALEGPSSGAGASGSGAGAAAAAAPAAGGGAGSSNQGGTGGGGGCGGGCGAGPSQAPPDPQQQRAAMVDRLREDPYAAMLAARAALHNNPRLAVARHREEGAFGGFSANASNQQLLTDEPSTSGAGTAELEFLMQLPADQQIKVLKRLAKKRKKEEEERKLREAEAVLLAAGYDLSAMAAGAQGDPGGRHSGSKHKKKRSKSKGHKHRTEERSRKSKKRRRRAAESSGSGSGSESDSSTSSSSG